MQSDNERLAVVEQKTSTQGEILKRVDETLTQLRIYTESSQRLLESHENGIKELNKRELHRERHQDERFDTILDKIHKSEIDRSEQSIKERLMLEGMLKDYNSTIQMTIKTMNENDEKREMRIRNLENLKWKMLGIVATVSTIVGFVAPSLIRQFLS